MPTTLDLADIKVTRVASPVISQHHDDCDIWNNSGHDGGPGHGGDDFDVNDCG